MTPPFNGRPEVAAPALKAVADPPLAGIGDPALSVVASPEVISPRPAPRVVRTVPPAETIPGWRERDADAGVSPAWRVAKRALDVTFALCALLVALPVFALVAIAIKLESPGPVFYRTRRMGYRAKPFAMLKFRKMHRDASGSPLTTTGDERFTRVGAFLTASRLDELPQLWDVLRGRMSVIGPRPEDPRFVDLHAWEYNEILTVRPGMLGLAQLAYQAEKDILDAEAPVDDYVDRIMPQKLILDQLYARQTSLRLDLSIVRWAIVALLLRRPVAVHRRTGEMSVRRPGPRRTTPGTTAGRG